MLLPLVLLALIASPADSAPRKPDFSGAWVMDPARSESAQQAAPVTKMSLVITQSPADIVIETHRGGDGEPAGSTETLTYRLDGSELSISGASSTPVRTRARWDGSKLITETSRSINGAAVSLSHVLSLDPGGKVLTVVKTLTVQHGYQGTNANNSGSGKDVFVRAKRAGK